MQELPFLHSAHRLMLIDICMKFREDSFRDFQVTERTRFVTDRRISGRPGKTICLPTLGGGGGGGRHNSFNNSRHLSVISPISEPTFHQFFKPGPEVGSSNI